MTAKEALIKRFGSTQIAKLTPEYMVLEQMALQNSNNAGVGNVQEPAVIFLFTFLMLPAIPWMT